MTALHKRTTVAMSDSMWQDLTAALDLDVETAWTLVARVVRADDGDGSITLVGRQLHPVPEAACRSRTEDGLSITPNGWLPAFRAADNDGAVPVFIHTHPRHDPRPSRRDFEVDDKLSRVAQVRVAGGGYGSLIIGGTSDAPTVTGRLHLADGGWQNLTHLRAVGEKVHLVPAWTADASHVSDAFDRQIRAFGLEGQYVLSCLRVGVVGAGGTGSAVIEQLIRLGVGELVVLDHQTLTDTNVTRVYGSGAQDEDALKVELVERQADRIGLGTRVLPVPRKITNLAAAQALAHCDVILNCTDDNLGRTIVTRFPLYFHQLLIDCGVVIDSRDEVLYEIFGRISIVAPGAACLVCMREIDPDKALAESLSDQEYAARRREGYVPELDVTDPAVVSFTTAVAAAVVSELLERLFRYGEPIPSNRLLHRFAARSISRTTRHRVGTHHCGSENLRGAGEHQPFLGRIWPDEF